MRKLILPNQLPDKGIPYSRSQINRLIKEGKFPRPAKLGGGNRNAFVESEIDEYIESNLRSATAPPDRRHEWPPQRRGQPPVARRWPRED